ncbi:MAG: hypothetical protein AAF513_01550 [Pseudomonadota bacterium]
MDSAVEAVYDDLDQHMAHERDIAAAAMPMGLLLAWTANLQLLDESRVSALAPNAERLLLRIRYREVKGSELLIAIGGSLRRELFTPAGQTFLDDYYEQYLADLGTLFGPDIYGLAESWDNYDILAKHLTARLMASRGIGVARRPLLSRIRGYFSRVFNP